MKTALLCVSFGTGVPAAQKSIASIEGALRQEMPEADFFRAFSSQSIRKTLAARGELVWGAEEALEHLADSGYERVVVQPIYFLCGLEYEALKVSAARVKNRFSSLLLGTPLISDTEALQRLAALLAEEYRREEGTALVFAGHGTPGFANAVYPALQAAFHGMGRRDVSVGTVTGWPGIQELCSEWKAAGFTRVRIVPLLLAAGKHALTDVAGQKPNSWRSLLTREGYEVECVLRGLGELPGVREHPIHLSVFRNRKILSRDGGLSFYFTRKRG